MKRIDSGMYVQLVGTFMNKFSLGRDMNKKRYDERDALLVEEFNELDSAESEVDWIDAAVDIVYVAAGTIVCMLNDENVRHADVIFRSVSRFDYEPIKLTDDERMKIRLHLDDTLNFVLGKPACLQTIGKLVSLISQIYAWASDEGYEFDDHFYCVHSANMKKVRGTKSTRPGTDGNDVVKPEGWIGPDEDHRLIIARRHN